MLTKLKIDQGALHVPFFWPLQVELCDFSQAEKERTDCKVEQIHKMTTIFTQKDNLGPFKDDLDIHL